MTAEDFQSRNVIRLPEATLEQLDRIDATLARIEAMVGEESGVVELVETSGKLYEAIGLASSFLNRVHAELPPSRHREASILEATLDGILDSRERRTE